LIFAADATLGIASAATTAAIATMLDLVTMVMSLPVLHFWGEVRLDVDPRASAGTVDRTEPFGQPKQLRLCFKMTEPFGHNQLTTIRYQMTFQRRRLMARDNLFYTIKINIL
jgi:hypothetical protein